MSFLLQGNARSLSFHGEANAPSPSSPGALGKPRVRKPSMPPRASIPQPTTRMGDQPIRTPYPGRIPTPIPGLHEARSPYAQRAPLDETFSDQDPTMALGHADADVMPGARIPARPLPAAGRPIPHFRGGPPPVPAPPSIIVHDTGSSRVTSKPGGAWLGLLAASLVLGLASYHFSPNVLAKVAPAPTVASHTR